MSIQENFFNLASHILQCTQCKFLPKSAVFQCPQGHLICNSCLTVKKFLSREGPPETWDEAPCLECGTLLSKTGAARNLAVERVIQELPTDCRFCSQSLPRRLKDSHELDECTMRPTGCHYRVLGCTWRGPLNEARAHEGVCPWPRKPGAELLSTLHDSDQVALQDRKQRDRVFDLLSAEAIVFEDFQLKPKGKPSPDQDSLEVESYEFEAFQNTWEVQARIKHQPEGPELIFQGCQLFESPTFSAFDNSWLVRFRSFRSPLSTVPEFSYQLMLKSNKELPCEVNFCLLQGPLGDFKVKPKINKHKFYEENDASCDVTLCFTYDDFTCKNVSTNSFNFRIFMFLTPRWGH